MLGGGCRARRRVSAGSICWYVGGPTDSFGRDLRPVLNGLALLPYGNGVHYDTEEQRRPLLHRLVAEGTLPTSHATDDGVGIVYDGTEIVEVVADRPGAAAYVVERGPDGAAVETRLEPRLLPGAEGWATSVPSSTTTPSRAETRAASSTSSTATASAGSTGGVEPLTSDSRTPR